MTKRLTAGVLSLLLILSLLPAPAQAADTAPEDPVYSVSGDATAVPVPEPAAKDRENWVYSVSPEAEPIAILESDDPRLGDWSYVVTSAEEITLTAYHGSAEDVTVPDTLGEYRVTAIGGDAFADNTTLKTVAVPESVSVHNGAFSGCTRLNRIFCGDWGYKITNAEAEITQYSGGKATLSIPDYLNGVPVTAIGSNVFYANSTLTVVQIPPTVKSMGSNAFSSCSALTAVRISSLPAWCGVVFSNASANPLNNGNVTLQLSDSGGWKRVTELKDLDSLQEISDYAFIKYTRLKSVALPEGLLSIGESAFSGCTGLEEVTFPSTLKTVGDRAFYGCTALNAAELPSGLESIGASAFYNCRALARLVFPASIETVGGSAFSNCKITDVYLDDLAAWCGITFSDAASNPLNGAGTLYVRDIPVTDLVLPSGIETVARYAFYGYTKLECVIFPPSIRYIYSKAFQNCTGLKTLLLPSGIESIALDAFPKLSDVYYTGDRDDWKAVANYDEITANVHFDTPAYTVVFTDREGRQTEQTAALGDRRYMLPGCGFDVPEGKNFRSWQINEKEYVAGNTFTPADEADAGLTVTVTALWDDVNYTVRFEPGEEGTGDVVTKTVPYGSGNYKLPRCSFNPPVGKTFQAWQLGGSNGPTYGAGDAFMPTEDVTFTALWTDITYTIDFKPGEGGSGAMENGTAVYGVPYTPPEGSFTPPTGKYFKAWKLGDTELLPGNSFVATADTTLTAVWGNRVELSFASGEGGTGTMKAIPAAKGNSVLLPDCGFAAPKGKGFLAWQVDGNRLAPGQAVILDKRKTATAVWETVCTATFDADGGKGRMDSMSALKGKTITLPACDFTPPSGKSDFRAWQIGEQRYQPGKEFTLTGDVTVKAVWTEVFTVRFAANGGSGTMGDQEIPDGGTLVLPGCTFTAPQDKGFRTWKIDTRELAPGAEYTVTASVTVEAVWSPLRSVAFDANGGSGTMEARQAPEGTAFVLPENGFDAPENMDFLAWEVDGKQYEENATISVTGDMAVKAVWSPLYSITFDAGDGSGTMNVRRVAEGKTFTLPRCDFTAPAGSVFEAWEIDGVKYAVGSGISPAGNTAVKAVWNAEYECAVSNGQTTVTKYKGSGGEVTVPAILGGYPVTVIGSSAFSGCAGLTKITVPRGVTAIGDSAFYRCTGLTAASLPETVTAIGASAFSGCKDALREITLPNGVKTVGGSAFSGCNKLVRVDLPPSLEEVGTDAFSGCGELTGVYITDLAAWCAVKLNNADANPLSIAKHLYLDNREVTELRIPTGVTAIGSYAFYNCIYLETLKTLPDTVTEIGSYAFYGCTGLQNTEAFPDSLTGIGSHAFYGCSGLTTIERLPGSLESIGPYAFEKCVKLANVVLPDGLTALSEGAFYGCSGLKDVTVPASIVSMGSNAFYGCKLSAVHITDLAKWCNIDFASESNSPQYSNPLNGAQSLYVLGVPVTDLTIQDKIGVVSNYAFYGFEGLKCVIIPQKATIIYRYAFTNCKNLEYILLPEGMGSLGENAFSGCGNLTDVYFTGTEEQWNETVRNYQQLVKDTIKVHYDAKQITVTLDPGEGYGDSVQTSAISGRAYVLTEPSFTAPEGKNFRSWQIGEKTYRRGESFTPTDNTTVTALWGEISYQLDFNSNGGDGTIDSMIYEYGDAALALPECAFKAPVGKQFKEWLIDGKSYAPGDELTPEKNLTAVAVWEDLDCHISFDPGEGGTGDVYTITEKYQTAVKLPTIGDCGFAPPEGKEFQQWSLSNGSKFNAGANYRPTADVTFTALWKDRVCFITFDPGEGGTGSMNRVSITYGQEYTLPRCKYTAQDKAMQGFQAWEINGETYADGDKITVTDDLTVTAVWADVCQITYITGNGGTGEKQPDSGVVGKPFTMPRYSPLNATDPNWQFRYWRIAEQIDGQIVEGEYAAGEVFTPSSTAVTATAVWGPKSYAIIFESGNGETDTQTGYHDVEFTLPPCSFPAPIDLEFKAWKQGGKEYTPGEKVKPTGKMTFQAVWTGTFLYSVSSECTTVTDYTGTSETAVIPPILGGYPVTAIGASAFANHAELTEVRIPEGVTSIGSSAFSGCSALKTAQLPESLLRIDSNAFSGCKNLTDLTVPGQVASIGKKAFSGCERLTRATLPPSLKTVGSNAFSGCKALAAVYISDLAAWCGVAFQNSEANPLSFAKNLYLDGKPVTELSIPAGVAAIGSYAFYNCALLETVKKLPNTVTEIGSYAFYGCTNLKNIEAFPDNMTSIGTYAFSGCSALESVSLPGGISAIANGTFVNCGALKRAALPDGLTEIGVSAFSNCSALTELNVPASVKVMRSSVFSGCRALDSVSITDLAAWCAIEFANTQSNPLYYAKTLYFRGIPVTDLTIQDNTDIIQTYAFYNFQGLRCVIVPQNAAHIYSDAFSSCPNLEYILLPEGMKTLDPKAFDNCKKLRDVYFTGAEEQWQELPNHQQFDDNANIEIHWAAKKITITFDADNGSGTREETSAIADRAYVLTGCPFRAPEGKSFLSWKIGDTEYAVGDSFVTDKDLTVTAVWGDAVAASVDAESILHYQLHITVPQGARLLAVGYDGAGRQLWTSLVDNPQPSGDLKTDGAERYKLFLLQGDTLVPICPNWDSAGTET